ncbi:MAG TPA: 2-oxoacid:acceptor oxidoreductase family protein [Thermoplasmata archaeon]|nr:2-oxoacid:acceptor oxidoreductase family protein [Thermoplasmata archaeon]
MIEIRFHGRGGQGAVVASELLAQAAFLDGLEPQSFPFFGVERRGAPVTAYARIDRRPIALRTRVTAPDVVVVLDPGLLRAVPVTLGLKPEGLLLVNSPSPPEGLGGAFGGRTGTVDGTAIALDLHLGTVSTPIVNTTVLGAVARATGAVSLDALKRAIERFVPTKPEENVLAAERGYAAVRLLSPKAVEVAA